MGTAVSGNYLVQTVASSSVLLCCKANTRCCEITQKHPTRRGLYWETQQQRIDTGRSSKIKDLYIWQFICLLFLLLLSVFLWCFLSSILIERVSQLEARQHCGLYLRTGGRTKIMYLCFGMVVLFEKLPGEVSMYLILKSFARRFPSTNNTASI